MFANLPDYYTNKFIFTLAALLVGIIVSYSSKKIINVLFLGVSRTMRSEHASAKTQTIRSILKHSVDGVILILVLLIILSQWGVDIIPLLTGAGLLGLAISFGAQTLVKDIISGFFIILEDQYNVGDHIKVDKYEGDVYRITLRLTILRDKNENLIYIPNSQMTIVMRYLPKKS